jgi:glycosyltransferase involved in cell wall biosynthesis
MISVCIATYNGEKYIKEQLNSILTQIDLNDEVVVSDDSSTDKTIEIIEKYNDSRIKIYQNNKFRNPIYNFENALIKCSGDIIFLSDQDDIWPEDKVVDYMGKLKEYDVVFSNVNLFKNDFNKTKEMFVSGNNNKGLVKNIIKNHCIGATMAFKKELLRRALPFPKHIPMHDIWIYSLGSIFGKTFYFNKPYLYYRRHGNNATNTGVKTENNLFVIIKNRILLVVALFMRIIKVSFT